MEPDHYFLELNNDITGQQWQWNDIAGEQTSKTKFNLSLVTILGELEELVVRMVHHGLLYLLNQFITL